MYYPNKRPYETPELETWGIIQAGFICTSPDEATENVDHENPFVDGEDW